MPTSNVQTLSVAQWCAMAREGIRVPVTITLSGYSMQPLLRRGKDPVTVMPLERPVLAGDIVMFQRRDGVYVMHRVRRVLPDAVITLGDGCLHEDSPLVPSQVLGLAVRAKRGRLSLDLNCPASRLYGRFWMAILPLRAVVRKARGLASRVKHFLLRTEKGSRT